MVKITTPKQLVTPEVIADPYPAYRELGDRSPFEFVWLPAGITPGIETALRSWAFLRYDDVYAALRDHDACLSVPTPLTRKALPLIVPPYTIRRATRGFAASSTRLSPQNASRP